MPSEMILKRLINKHKEFDKFKSESLVKVSKNEFLVRTNKIDLGN